MVAVRKEPREKKTLKQRFIEAGYSVTKYARHRVGVDPATLQKLLDGRELHWRRGKKTRKIILQLKADGVWTEALPWEEER